MKEFLDASGLNLYHTQSKAKVDASIIALETAVEDLETDFKNLVPQVTLEVSPTIIYVGVTTSLDFTATCEDSATSIVIKDQNDNTIASGSGTSITGTASVTPDSEGNLSFTCNAVIDDSTYTYEVNVQTVGKVYYGCGSSVSDASNVYPINDNPNGTYKFDVSTNGEHLILAVPQKLGYAIIYMNGMEVPNSVTKATIDGLTYNVYTSINTYNEGSYRIIVDSIDPFNGHAYVDLGLPSGTLWATMNVGASSVTEFGNYYKYGKGSDVYNNSQPNYTGTEDPLALSADTAAQVWGGNWHMPTSAQCQELINNTTSVWVTNYQGSGINGRTFTAQNGNTLFIPAAGYWMDGSKKSGGSNGFIWTSTPVNVSAYFMYFGNGIPYLVNTQRSMGLSIRGVVG